MFVTVVMTAVRMAAMAFCLRLLAALVKERPPRVTGYWVRLRLRSGEDKLEETQERRQPVPRAA